jgi:anaerobic glycerol-3-phosphate dehydrogenase
MSNGFTIEKGVPLPELKSLVSSVEILAKMSDGDSVLLSKQAIHQLARYARRHKYKVVTKEEGKECARLWLVAPIKE